MTTLDLMDKINDLLLEYFDEHTDERFISEDYHRDKISIKLEVENWRDF